jgi:hypothetical protein
LSYRQGITDRNSIFTGLNTTALLFGVLYTDIGMLHCIKTSNNLSPGICISPIFNISTDFENYSWRVYPQIDLNCYFDYKANKTIYFGIHNFFDLYKFKANQVPNSDKYIPSIYLGYHSKRKIFNYKLEMKYLAPAFDNQNAIIEYMSPKQQGAFGLYFSISKPIQFK